MKSRLTLEVSVAVRAKLEELRDKTGAGSTGQCSATTASVAGTDYPDHDQRGEPPR